jgi:hypothetical protein
LRFWPWQAKDMNSKKPAFAGFFNFLLHSFFKAGAIKFFVNSIEQVQGFF